MALSGLAVRSRRLDPGRRSRGRQGRACRRPGRDAPRRPASASRRPRRRRAPARPALRRPVRLRRRRRSQRRRRVVRRAEAVICVSRYLQRELETKLPEARGKVEVVSSGIDREHFAVTECPPGPPGVLCVGALDERKNVVRLADAFARLGEGTLTFAGDGPLRSRLEGRERVRLLGRVPHDEIPRLLAECHVLAQPSLVEPLGQALLEAMACGRSVVATRIGGPPEFVPPEAGVLVDPLDVDALARGLELAAALPCPNEAAREATEEHDARRQAERIEAILTRAATRGQRA